MAYYNLNKLPKEERIRMIGEFYNVIDSLKNREEIREFFRDLLTPNEIGNLMSRIEVALLLILGFSYEEITQFLGIGKDKILRVNKKLNSGGKGYRIAIQRLLEKRKKRKIKEIKYRKKLGKRIKPFSLENLKKRYPAYFLLNILIDEALDHLDALSQIKSPKEEVKEFYQKRRKKK